MNSSSSSGNDNNNNNNTNSTQPLTRRPTFFSRNTVPTDFSKECTSCHQLSGALISASGIYSLYIRSRYPENKTWLTIVGVSTLSFGIYWGVIHKMLYRDQYKD